MLLNTSADYTSAQCVASCPAGNYLCYGRGVSHGVSFCATADLSSSRTNSNIVNCNRLENTTLLSADFD